MMSINDKKNLQRLKQAVSLGKKVLLENTTEEIDSALSGLLSRQIIKKSQSLYVNIAGELVEYHPQFRLFLQCKRQNPHFRPEIAAQCTIINFIVTEQGLEEQLLAMVVNFEKQELELRKQQLVRQQNQFEVSLSELEVQLLESLSRANPETILDDTELINNLDQMKKTSVQISLQKEEAKLTEERINQEREKY